MEELKEYVTNEEYYIISTLHQSVINRILDIINSLSNITDKEEKKNLIRDEIELIIY